MKIQLETHAANTFRCWGLPSLKSRRWLRWGAGEGQEVEAGQDEGGGRAGAGSHTHTTAAKEIMRLLSCVASGGIFSLFQSIRESSRVSLEEGVVQKRTTRRPTTQ